MQAVIENFQTVQARAAFGLRACEPSKASQGMPVKIHEVVLIPDDRRKSSNGALSEAYDRVRSHPVGTINPKQRFTSNINDQKAAQIVSMGTNENCENKRGHER